MAANYVIKVAWEAAATPLTYKIVRFPEARRTRGLLRSGHRFQPFHHPGLTRRFSRRHRPGGVHPRPTSMSYSAWDAAVTPNPRSRREWRSRALRKARWPKLASVNSSPGRPNIVECREDQGGEQRSPEGCRAASHAGHVREGQNQEAEQESPEDQLLVDAGAAVQDEALDRAGRPRSRCRRASGGSQASRK